MSTPLPVVTARAARPAYQYIAIEGPIGAGKTALATRLAERWSMQTLFESHADNPFLERFWRDASRHALAAQLSVALQRERLSHEVAARRAAGVPLVTNFLAERNDVFARLTLPEDELPLYRALAERLPAQTSAPDLVVYLQASPEALYARIQKRAVAAEQHISDAFLRSLCDSYNEFFYHYDHAPVLTVGVENLHPLDSDADLALIAERIETMRGRKESFVKGTSL
ncbi:MULTISPECIES: deoxynucleoside kinase [Paraburkholderia]|uniref:Deoxyadenosine/deoxycytidine kinase n=1 Tax=Paraburkholderia tropica TaxID=92647 RepID=A0A1A5XP43_9BURK|nr:MULTISPECIES: deoxynucleoside kinase [Paraburkholderia]MBB2977328.1 deoxyadenosine/deoxycytidine kinase [Paraburkholderia tropica]MBB2997810.1 deoxyadenosine/deoxycytidine kinase [Paraburkholderia tropica]MBB6316832.1 deoxyadenosine/deoxycytidine kinase [Paraburkholderia tropica]MDE1142013.1 deoxynucleoside kinase [Paraburkholderia tropica]OBR54900.1 deoxyadenosine kinase [Paraburkholderia tropica]